MGVHEAPKRYWRFRHTEKEGGSESIDKSEESEKSDKTMIKLMFLMKITNIIIINKSKSIITINEEHQKEEKVQNKTELTIMSLTLKQMR